MMRSPLSKCGGQILDDRVDGRASGHEHHDRTRWAEQSDKVIGILHPASVPISRFLPQDSDLVWVLVIARHRKAVVGHVQREIAPHDAQAGQADCILLLCLLMGHGFAFRAVCG
jgi:hypothetical protein